MRIASWLIGVASVLVATTARAGEETYAKLGGWEITHEPGLKRCSMQRFYRAKSGSTEGLIVVYDAEKEGVLLFWSTTSMPFLPTEGHLDLDLRLRNGALIDETWGNQDFRYEKVADSHIFTRAFLDRESSRRILADLASHAEIGLFLGPVLQTAFPLGPAGVVGKLTECSTKVGLP